MAYTKAQLEALKNSILASAQPITAAQHRSMVQNIIDEMYDAQSRGNLLAGVQADGIIVEGDTALVIRSGQAYLIPLSALIAENSGRVNVQTFNYSGSNVFELGESPLDVIYVSLNGQTLASDGIAWTLSGQDVTIGYDLEADDFIQVCYSNKPLSLVGIGSAEAISIFDERLNIQKDQEGGVAANDTAILNLDTVGDFTGLNRKNRTRFYVNDLARGGLFSFVESGVVADGGTVFALPDGFAVRNFEGPVNAKWFGASGDGVTDDSAALALAFSSGLPLILPKGDFVTTGTLVLQGSISGEGTLVHKPTTDGINCLETSANNLSIKGIQISNTQNGATDKFSGNGIHLIGCTNTIVEGCRILGNFSSNRSMIYVSPAPVEQCMLLSGIALSNCVDCSVFNCSVSTGVGVAYRVSDESINCKVHHNISNDTRRGYMVDWGADINFAPEDISISNNRFIRARQAGGKIEPNCRKIVLENNHFIDCLEQEIIDGTSGSQIAMIYGYEVVFRNNYIFCENVHASHISLVTVRDGGSVPASGIRCVIEGNQILGAYPIDDAIRLQNATYSVIRGNNIKGITGGNGIQLNYSFESTVDGNVIADVSGIGITEVGSVGYKILNNTVSNCLEGIRLRGLGGLADAYAVIHGNLVSGSTGDGTKGGIYLYQLRYFSASNNIVLDSGATLGLAVYLCEDGAILSNLCDKVVTFSGNTNVINNYPELGYTPVNKAGDTMSGNLAISKSFPILSLTESGTDGAMLILANSDKQWRTSIKYQGSKNNYIIRDETREVNVLQFDSDDGKATFLAPLIIPVGVADSEAVRVSQIKRTNVNSATTTTSTLTATNKDQVINYTANGGQTITININTGLLTDARDFFVLTSSGNNFLSIAAGLGVTLIPEPGKTLLSLGLGSRIEIRVLGGSLDTYIVYGALAP